MGKIVKYCTVCEEGFAEKFSFCPNCAASLTAFEMNPLAGIAGISEPVTDTEPVEETVQHFEADAPSTISNEPTAEAEPTRPSFLAPEPAFPSIDDSEILDLHSVDTIDEDEDVTNEEPAALGFEPIPATTTGSFSQPYAANDQPARIETEPVVEPVYTAAATTPTVPAAASYSPTYRPAGRKTGGGGDDGYHITMVERKDRSTVQMLLLGAFLVVMCGTFGSILFSLFNNNLNIGAIDEDSVIAYLPVEADDIKEEKPEVKKEDKGGGGGGGGKKDPTPTSQGDIARQMKSPTVPPSANMDRVTTPSIPLTVATEGPPTKDTSKDRYGNPNSKYTIGSDGMGSGGGQGEGNGRGQGNGNGTGRGNGDGSGSGNGVGNGNGNGNGDGSGDGEPPQKKAAVTEPLKILAKPKGLYTDAARQNQVQGTVRLRVTFLASGAVGSISVVSGLGNGLTEQAIAAARAIRFEPQKVNGSAVATTKQIDYTFTLY